MYVSINLKKITQMLIMYKQVSSFVVCIFDINLFVMMFICKFMKKIKKKL